MAGVAEVFWQLAYHLPRMNRWSKARGVLDRIFARLQQEQILAIRIEHVVASDSTTIKVRPDGTGALKKTARKPLAVPGRLHCQDSSGCRECSVRPDLEAFPRSGG